MSPRDLSIDPTGRILVVPGFDNAIHVSTDRGQTWNSYPVPGDDLQQVRLIGHDLYFAVARVLYVIRNIDGTPEPVRKLFTSTAGDQFVEEVAGDANRLVLSTPDALYVSHDQGVSWQPSKTAPQGETFRALDVVNGDLYASTESEIFVDRTGGNGWSTIPVPVAGDVYRISSPQAGRLVISAASNGVFLTDDNGATYQRVGLTSADVHALAVGKDQSDQATLVAGTTFSTFEHALPVQRVPGPADRDWGYNGADGLLGNRVTAVTTDPADARRMFRAVANAQSRPSIDESTDGGVTWKTELGVQTDAYVYQLVVDPANRDYIYAAIVDLLGPGVVVARMAGRPGGRTTCPSTSPRSPQTRTTLSRSCWVDRKGCTDRTTAAGRSAGCPVRRCRCWHVTRRTRTT